LEEDIDLRPYLRASAHRWWWAAGMGLVAAVVAFVVSVSLTKTYEASAVVIVTQPQNQLQTDPRFETTQLVAPPYKAFPTLATSDGLLQSVLDGFKAPAGTALPALDLATLSRMLSVSSASDPSVLVLQAQTHSPQVSASLANLWAELLVEKGNAVYNSNAQDVTVLNDQATQAKQALDQANAALIEFQSHDPLSTLQAQLGAEQQAQKDYLSTQTAITNVIQDVEGLRDQLAKEPAGQADPPADSLTALLLEIKAFNANASAFDAGASLPIQLQISGAESLSSTSRQDQVAALENLVATLQNKSAETAAQLAALEPKMMATQRQVAEVQTELDDLVRQQTLAEDTYKTVAGDLSESQVAAQTVFGMLRVGSLAGVPQQPASPRPLRNSVMAGVVGLLLGACAVFAAEWWRR
jgi:uncharacterized protein involved in exopolysaccharide biosynthesis